MVMSMRKTLVIRQTIYDNSTNRGGGGGGALLYWVTLGM